MDRENPSPRCPRRILTALACTAVMLLSAAGIGAQSRIIRPQPSSSNSNNSARRPRVTTLRSSDSPDGSRVALTSDQSLNDYEAYRRGDRFYVKIPPADVPRAEIVRGRAFADVKVNRAADSTVVSFRLQPGATARVEQRGNKLEVVFKMPGTASSPYNSTNRAVARNDAGPAPPNDPRRKPTGNSNSSALTDPQRSATNRSASERTAAAKAYPTPTPKPTPSPSPTAKPSPTSQTSPAVKGSPVVAQQRNSPTASPQAVAPTTQTSTWNNLKQRARYLILLAQLNPVPVVIGLAVLLLLIGLFILQRRRAKATRRVRPVKEATKAKPIPAVAVPTATQPTDPPVGVSKAPEIGAAVVGAVAASSIPGDAKPEEVPANGERNERVARVSDEVKKIMAGGDYDESVIASEDRDTRQLVGAELLSALVGRNLQRRERARAAFMKHGYFDDATRDLRTAESPNERAAAARRLSFVQDREATPHLIGGLDDPSPDVRCASVEALMDLRDPAAIAPLNSLMQTEADRKVPRTLIKHAIEACASSGGEVEAAAPAVSAPEMTSQPAETEREVIEI